MRRIEIIVILVLTITIAIPEGALADWKVYYTGKAAEMFGSHGRGNFATRSQCEAYRSSSSGFEQNNSYCSGFDNPSSNTPVPSRPSGNNGTTSHERERERQLQLQRDKDAREAEIARKEQFAKEKKQLVDSLKGVTGGGTLNLKSGIAPAVQLKGNSPDKKRGTFYTQDMKTLTPLNDGGHPIDAPGSPPAGIHGLVVGTTWTYGFKWPLKHCDAECKKLIRKKLDEQHALYCKSQNNPEDQEKCLKEDLPFTPESYDMVLSMGSAHTAIQDLATRVVWDGQSFGEFSRQNAPIFASLKGRHFDMLDCHSNGSMLCLAALRSKETTARKVRLFGPQINAEAAARWRDWLDKNPGSELEIYINNGDPIPAISWKQPVPQSTIKKVATAAWMTNPVGGPATLADALMHTWLDSKTAIMDENLGGYGFKVKRFYTSECDRPCVECHSMLLYEKHVDVLPTKH